MSDKEHRLATLGQIALTVSNIDDATAFYRDALGIPLMFEADNMAFFDLGPVRLMLAGEDGATKAGASSVLYFVVEDIEDMHTGLLMKGVSFERDPFVVHETDEAELWMSFFRDMDANLLAMMQEKPKKA